MQAIAEGIVMRLLIVFVAMGFLISAHAEEAKKSPRKEQPKETTMSAQREFIVEARVGADLQTQRIWAYNMGAAQQQFKSMYPGKTVSFTSGTREVK